MSNVEATRIAFRPARIATLFVGESAPTNGTFFYFGGTNLNRYMKNVIEQAFGPTADFLAAFKGYGWYLDDLVLTPIDKYGPAERRAECVAARDHLAKRIAEYQPQAIVTFMRGIGADVDAAATKAKSEAPRYVVSFPGQGNQARFRQEMTAILPLLPKL